MKMQSPVQSKANQAAFTLLELMVSMSITLILLGVVTYLTSLSSDTFRESRDEVRSARQAKEALDAIGKDFEAMVVRNDGSGNMWLYAAVEPELDGDNVANTTLAGPANKKMTNAARLIFFAGAADRYDGDIGGASDNGGDVCAVSYRLAYRDQISDLNPDNANAHPVFSLYRHVVDPDDSFSGKKDSNGNHVAARALLGVADLESVWSTGSATTNPPSYESEDFSAENVLVENIYQMTTTFLVLNNAGVQRITIGHEDPEVAPAGPYYALCVKGNGVYRVDAKPASDPISLADWGAAINGGQLIGVEITITVLSDRGLSMARYSGMSRGEIIAEYGHHYTRTINVPRS